MLPAMGRVVQMSGSPSGNSRPSGHLFIEISELLCISGLLDDVKERVGVGGDVGGGWVEED